MGRGEPAPGCCSARSPPCPVPGAALEVRLKKGVIFKPHISAQTVITILCTFPGGWGSQGGLWQHSSACPRTHKVSAAWVPLPCGGRIWGSSATTGFGISGSLGGLDEAGGGCAVPQHFGGLAHHRGL